MGCVTAVTRRGTRPRRPGARAERYWCNASGGGAFCLARVVGTSPRLPMAERDMTEFTRRNLTPRRRALAPAIRSAWPQRHWFRGRHPTFDVNKRATPLPCVPRPGLQPCRISKLRLRSITAADVSANHPVIIPRNNERTHPQPLHHLLSYLRGVSLGFERGGIPIGGDLYWAGRDAEAYSQDARRSGGRNEPSRRGATLRDQQIRSH